MTLIKEKSDILRTPSRHARAGGHDGLKKIARELLAGILMLAAGMSLFTAAALAAKNVAVKPSQHIQTLEEALAWTYVNNPSLQ
jgi:hypothetical protein